MSPAVWGAVVALAYVIGFTLGKEWRNPEPEHRDCFYCHECILCKRDPDASWCRLPPKVKVCETKQKAAPWHESAAQTHQ